MIAAQGTLGPAQADPNIKQFINENGTDVPAARQDALLKLALKTHALGGHIYGVGLQTHVYNLETDAISDDDLADTLNHTKNAGLLVHISENDVTDGHGKAPGPAESYATVLATRLRSRTTR